MKVSIVGNAVVATSEMSLADLKTIKKYHPEALSLMGGENGKEKLFTIDVADTGCGVVGQYGIVFAEHTHDEAKKACVTMCMSGVQGDIREIVADTLGPAIRYMAELEKTLPEVLTKTKDEKDAVLAAIQVV